MDRVRIYKYVPVQEGVALHRDEHSGESEVYRIFPLRKGQDTLETLWTEIRAFLRGRGEQILFVDQLRIHTEPISKSAVLIEEELRDAMYDAMGGSPIDVVIPRK